MNSQLDLYVAAKGCAPCNWIKAFVARHNIPVTIIEGGTHPLVFDVPALVIDKASIIRGVIAIQRYLETHVIPKEVTNC